jgi:hypothetical protein
VEDGNDRGRDGPSSLDYRSVTVLPIRFSLHACQNAKTSYPSRKRSACRRTQAIIRGVQLPGRPRRQSRTRSSVLEHRSRYFERQKQQGSGARVIDNWRGTSAEIEFDLTGIEPVKYQFSWVQFSLSQYIWVQLVREGRPKGLYGRR